MLARRFAGTLTEIKRLRVARFNRPQAPDCRCRARCLGVRLRERARRRRGKPGAEERLVAAVIHGAGPQNRHWKYKTDLALMPENRVAISEEDARALVRWILRGAP
ncbi:MAG TPA: hypothetical protein VE935_03255 [Burkholderiales bacterium]|jgi:hypothetical protein|nr:hypothetical protein [Burkholderiales bacterium]